MISLEDSKIIMKEAGLSEEALEEYGKLIEPFFEFSKYMCDKLNVSADIAEKYFNDYTKKYMIEKTANTKDLFNFYNSNDDIQNLTFNITGEAAENYALENEYDSEKAIILKNNIIELMNFMIRNFKK